MDFGVLMFFTDYAISAVDLAKALEERGFESVWAPEHSHIPTSRKTPFPGGGDLPKRYYDAMDPFVSLTAAAVATKTLKVGTGVCLVQQRDPIQTAKLVASIDQVSNGRFLFGVGGGWNQDEMENHGTEYKSRFKLMRERIEAMKEIWTKPKAQYHGDMVKFDEMMAWPKPVQKPYPPILVGGAFPQAARRAIRYGDGWCPIGGRPGSDPLAALDQFRQMAQGRRARPAIAVDHDVQPARGRRHARPLARPGCGPRRRHAAVGGERQDPAAARSLGGADPAHRALRPGGRV